MVLLDQHPTVSVGSLTIYIHGIFFALGALVATGLLAYLLRERFRFVEVLERALWIFLAGLIGARLGYLLTYIDQFERPAQIIQIWDGGLVSYFGIGAGLWVTWLYVRKQNREDRFRWYDTLMLASLVGWAIGRLGNYYGGESYGVTSTFWSLFYNRVPIQLFETLTCLILAAYLYKRGKEWPAGYIFFFGLLGYLGSRFVIDSWRDEAMLLGLHMSQWLALALGVLIYRKFRRLRS